MTNISLLRWLFLIVLIPVESVYAGQTGAETLVHERVVELMAAENWGEAKNLLSQFSSSDATALMLWGAWYGSLKNPEFDKKISTKFLENSAANGSQKAKLLLVGRYLFSNDPVYTDFKKGVDLAAEIIPWLSSESSGNNIEATRNLALIYLMGAGTQKDERRALGLYERAAQMGDKESIEKLIYMYQVGVGTEINLDRVAALKARRKPH